MTFVVPERHAMDISDDAKIFEKIDIHVNRHETCKPKTTCLSPEEASMRLPIAFCKTEPLKCESYAKKSTLNLQRDSSRTFTHTK